MIVINCQGPHISSQAHDKFILNAFKKSIFSNNLFPFFHSFYTDFSLLVCQFQGLFDSLCIEGSVPLKIGSTDPEKERKGRRRTFSGML